LIQPEDLRTLVETLTAVPGLAGHEDAVARLMADYLSPLADRVQIDVLGNVIARFGPENGAPRVALLAHIDTIGFLVKQVHTDGTLGLVPVGGANVRALSGAAVRVGGYPGVIGVKSQHLVGSNEPPPTLDDLYVQIDPAAPVEVTTPVLYAAQTVALGEHLICAPYLDNRAGCAVLLALGRELAQHPGGGTIYLIGTVQEETTCAGAMHVLQNLRPDAAFFVDGTLSYDTPDTRKFGSVRLGGGPVLTAFLYVSGLNGWHAHPALRAHLKQVAAETAIPVQQDAIRGLISDARVTTWLGIPSALVGLPMRGKHAPLETVHLGDLVDAARLLAAALPRPLPDLSRG
jgi:putative aminopeptidase FrvX